MTRQNYEQGYLVLFRADKITFQTKMYFLNTQVMEVSRVDITNNIMLESVAAGNQKS